MDRECNSGQRQNKWLNNERYASSCEVTKIMRYAWTQQWNVKTSSYQFIPNKMQNIKSCE